ncbi:MAG: hypothetical protein A2W03_04295 [Candidatus Aminicenantes bacterium RBG_16_63_16]|nr:MAG: hypothetical protein A2W03_04295 [Candidatus Aminicenantes bacterium RBG_16_63_16]
MPIKKNTWEVRGPAERITSGAGMQCAVSVLPDGRALYANLTWVANIFTLAARPDEGIVSGSPVPVTKDVTAKFSPGLSRDGSKLVYAAIRGLRNQVGEVRLLNLAIGEEKILPMRTSQLSLVPRISPDGTVLSYREREGERSRSFIVSGEEASPREVCDSCTILGFFSDPNLALVREKGEQLLRLNIATGEKTPVLEASVGSISSPALSPDDRWIAFILNKPDGRVAMFIAPVAGDTAAAPVSEKDWVLLFEDEHYLGSPAWSPGGNYLFYLSERDGACSVWTQKLESRSKRPDGAIRVIFRPQGRIGLNFPRGNGTVAVARDKLALWTGEGTGNIYLATPKKE